MTTIDTTGGSQSVPSRAPLLLGVEISLLMLAFLATALRTGLRKTTMGRIRMEDWCCIGATIVLINMVVVHALGTRHGIGMHIWDLNHAGDEDLIMNLKTAYIGRIFYPFATGLTRQSVLFLLLRIFPHKVFRRILIVVVVINALVSVGSCLVVAFQCSPIHTVFTSTSYEYRPKCLDGQNLALAIPSMNVILDLTVAILPVRMVLDMSLPTKSKAFILGMLGLGGCACVASGLRLFYIHRGFQSQDHTWEAVPICILAVAEAAMGIIAVSAPAIRPMLKGMNIHICSLHIKTKSDRDSISDLRTTKTGANGTKSSFALGSIKRPEKSKVRLQMRDGGSVERFRPNEINRTITEIEAGQDLENQDDIRGDTGHEEREDFAPRPGSGGGQVIVRRMEVAVTISDRRV
ncbi:uncharacterized protein LAJ45_04604 [Morchella importuna]|nr:uncharacterized protein LAJ45_04604 [Morchella importuna]KAH8151400.1 hypothetical protein LAJ45_04604 [Morchella importuna]